MRVEKEIEVSSNVVIDPSLLVANRTLESTVKKAGRRYEDLDFYLPQSFIELIEQNQSFENTPGFQYYIGNVQNTPEYRRFVQLVDTFSESIEGYTVPENQVEEYAEVYEAIAEELPYRRERFFSSISEPPYDGFPPYRDNQDLLTDAVFEEFVFLVEQSWMVSRTKKIYNTFIDAGASTMQFSKRTVEEARERLEDTDDKVIERMDKLKDDHDWQWVAIGGSVFSPILGFYFPPAGVAAGTGTGLVQAYIKLFDP
jgi:hypothetical protein